MAMMGELIELERRGWQALAGGGDAATMFYRSVLRDDAVMLLPGGVRIEGRDRILTSFAAQPWQTFRLDDVRVMPLGADAATVVYKATAQRRGMPAYAALISSTYVRERDWKLAVHQQTPV